MWDGEFLTWFVWLGVYQGAGVADNISELDSGGQEDHKNASPEIKA